jgi:hypothetical protein
MTMHGMDGTPKSPRKKTVALLIYLLAPLADRRPENGLVSAFINTKNQNS